MNAVYKQLLAELAGNEDKDQQRLKQAQLLWIQYRDANCESEASIYDGGSIRQAVYNTCLASITEERTRRMRAFLTTTRTVAGHLQSPANPCADSIVPSGAAEKENR
jgi:uncharacterized protein YecT (DUF1311 family)